MVAPLPHSTVPRLRAPLAGPPSLSLPLAHSPNSITRAQHPQLPRDVCALDVHQGDLAVDGRREGGDDEERACAAWSQSGVRGEGRGERGEGTL
jgi:hypothetical protein